MDLPALVGELKRTHGAHTVVLYGSRARGDATPESDIDVACFADVSESYQDARLWQDAFLDGFVYPTSRIEGDVENEMLKLVGGKAILDERGLAEAFLVRVRARDEEPVPLLREHERQAMRTWAHKTLARIRRGDIEGNYRYHVLLVHLLEDHFALLARRYRGPKRALAELAASDPSTFTAFEAALLPGAPFAAVERLVEQLHGAEATAAK